MNQRAAMLWTSYANAPVLKRTVYDKGDDDTPNTPRVNQFEKIFAALFYAFASLAVIFVNKIVLTSYHFPLFDVLATAQFAATSLIMTVLIHFKKVEVTRLSREVMMEVLPISLLFLANVVFGLGGTGSLNLPMFTALRRFSILFTMVGEYLILRRSSNNMIVVSVVMMVGGALVAAFNDLSFDLFGYTLVFFNNVFTAMSGIYLKKASMSGKCSKMGVLYYNSLFSLAIMLAYFGAQHGYITSLRYSITSDGTSAGMLPYPASAPGLSTLERVWGYQQWHQLDFLLTFVMASVMGSVLNYATFLCTTTNSALTTSVIGCLKNVLTTYIGMFTLGDYTFQWANFLGLNVSVLGSVLYSYVTFNNKD